MPRRISPVMPGPFEKAEAELPGAVDVGGVVWAGGRGFRGARERGVEAVPASGVRLPLGRDRAVFDVELVGDGQREEQAGLGAVGCDVAA